MHDELRSALARQGIGEEAYLKVVGKTEEELHAEFRPQAEKRVKTLAGPVGDRQGEGRRGPGGGRPGRDRAGPVSLREQSEPDPLLRIGTRPKLHPEHVPAVADGGAARRRVARRPPRIAATAPHRGRRGKLAGGRTRRQRPPPRSGPPIRAASRRRKRPPQRARSPSPARGDDPNARADGDRVLEPWRARLRHLLAASARADHLPRRRDRGQRREPGHRPAALPRRRGPRAGHQPLHQLARRGHHQRPGDLRHDAVRAGPGQHDLHRHGGQHGGRPARRRRPGQALRAAAQPDHDPPGFGRLPGQHAGRLHPGQGDGDSGQHQSRDPEPPHGATDREDRCRYLPGLLHVPNGGQGLRHNRRCLLGHGIAADEQGRRRRRNGQSGGDGDPRRRTRVPQLPPSSGSRRRREGRVKARDDHQERPQGSISLQLLRQEPGAGSQADCGPGRLHLRRVHQPLPGDHRRGDARGAARQAAGGRSSPTRARSSSPWTSTSSARRRPRRSSRSPSTTTTSGSTPATRSTTSSSRSRTSCSSAPPARARRCWPRPWPRSWTCRSASPTPRL